MCQGNPWSISNKLTNMCGVSYRTQFEAFISSSQYPKSILLAYERAKRRKCQEDKGIFKHEPTYNVYYNQDMDIEFEGMDKDEAEALKMMSLHGSNVPYDTWNLKRGFDYDWSVPNFPRDKHLWDTAETFLSYAKENLNKESSHADIPMRFIQGEIIQYNINEATKSQEAVLNKVFGKIREWMVWEESDKNDPFIPLMLTVRGAAGNGKSYIINTIVSYVRRMFGDNDVVHVLDPPGIAAFNVLGETIHRFAGID
jgi:hypothetical protein